MDLRQPLIEATKKLKALREEVDTLTRRQREPIAIVAVDCRLPGGADDAERYWRLLDEGGSAIGPFPRDRWRAEELYDPDPADPVMRCSLAIRPPGAFPAHPATRVLSLYSVFTPPFRIRIDAATGQ